MNTDNLYYGAASFFPSIKKVMAFFTFMYAFSMAYSQTYYLHVGEPQFLGIPNTNYVVKGSASWGCTHRQIVADMDDKEVGPIITIKQYFSDAATISVTWTEEYFNQRTGHSQFTAHGHTWTIRCIPVNINLAESNIEMKPGDTKRLNYSWSESGWSSVAQVNWVSSDPSIATVESGSTSYNSYANITAKKPGNVTITANTNMGPSAVCNVTVAPVNPINVTGITLNNTSASIAVGDTKQLSATISPSNATDKSVTWSSSNTNVATVSSNGLVTAKAEGKATITCQAKDGSGVKAHCEVTVILPIAVEINATTFPDENFRKFLLEQYYGKDGVITEAELSRIKSLNIPQKGIRSLTGVERFTALTYLNCFENQLTSLDVSKNTALTVLYCWRNQLTSLDVSKNTALTDLSCSENQLTSLDVSKNTALTDLDCYSNQLTSLDVSKNTALTFLSCDDNLLTSLDVSKNTVLTRLWCSTNQLTSLDVSKNTALTFLDCNRNLLTSLDVSKNTVLTYLWCSTNQLTSLDVSKNTELKYIICANNQISGSAMDQFISSLPKNSTDEVYQLEIVNIKSDKNICTKAQVAAIKAKRWTPVYYDYDNDRGYVEFEGFDDTPMGISLPTSETVNVRETITLKPALTPTNANTTLTWESDDTTIAKVSQSGVVMGLKAGTAIISVKTSNNLVAECFVVVVDPSGINEVQRDNPSSTVIYTISGQRIEKPHKGINIINGRKVIVK